MKTYHNTKYKHNNAADVLEWLLCSRAWRGDDSTCAALAAGGHIAALQVALRYAVPLDKWACASAAKAGQLETLQFLRAVGAPWDIWCGGIVLLCVSVCAPRLGSWRLCISRGRSARLGTFGAVWRRHWGGVFAVEARACSTRHAEYCSWLHTLHARINLSTLNPGRPRAPRARGIWSCC